MKQVKVCKNPSCNNELTGRQTKYCSNKCKYENAAAHHPSNTNKRNDESKSIRCKQTGKVFSDVNNISGILTKYSHKVLNRDYDVNDWEVIDSDPVEKFKCPECDWESVDTTNKSGWITTHIKKHGHSISSFVEKYPEHSHMFTRKLNRIDQLTNDSVECEICKKKFKKITNTHLKDVHDITMSEYISRYPDAKVLNDGLQQLHKEISKQINQERGYAYRSSIELEIEEFIRSFYTGEVLTNFRGFGQELDLYLPDKNLAIEYNGFPWHTEYFGGKHKTYHLDKTMMCEDNRVKLIHIFADEYHSRGYLVKDKIRHAIIKSSDKVYARKCEVVDVTPDYKSEFLNDHHIQGNGKGKFIYGLKYNGELIAIATFSKPRTGISKSTDNIGKYELVRYASKVPVLGGLDKLISRFGKDHTDCRELISYADRRWTYKLDNIYMRTGWEMVSSTKPNYWYIKNRQRIHRYSMTKHRLVEMGGDPSMTEFEIALSMGYDRIWDCGNLKYVKIINNE